MPVTDGKVAVDGPIVRARGLTVRFPVRRSLWRRLRRYPQAWIRAVDGVDLDVRPGEILALVGESGSGKTTTAFALMALHDARSAHLEGEVEFAGRPVLGRSSREMRALRRKMQVVYQDPYEAMDPRLRVRQIVREPLDVHRVGDKAFREAAVSRALEQVGLDPEVALPRYPHQLSGGERQRVAIAAALVLEPRLIVADEPVSMLDMSVRAGVLDVLERIRDEGVGVLMITHDLSTVAERADRVAVMYLGRVVEQGDARRVIEEPQHPYTRALLSVIPSLDPDRHRVAQLLPGDPPSPAVIPSGCRFNPRCPSAIAACSDIDPPLAPVEGDRSRLAACIRVPSA
jgi:oligopeptide/dipeptide ABC transporter ATP-binding protein